uniref:Ig-like domain-containing protein n=1 Tax=Sinocyclocheilus grahami TaxID=75366 RepID=A0A672L7W4_SINGR
MLSNNQCMTAALDIMCVLCSDLQVEAPERVTEGDSVRLTCKSSYRNNQLLLQSVRREDAGRYSCALQEHTYISPAVHLSVTCEYRFISILIVDVSVSISPSGEIVEGDSVALSCSSDSNPPAEISWFKGGTIVGSGRIYSISKISADHSGEYKYLHNCRPNVHAMKEGVTLILAVLLLLPLLPCYGDAVCFIVIAKLLCLAFQKKTQLEISG